MLTFPCEQCGATIGVADEHAGRKIVCPSCKTVSTAPDATMAVPVEAITATPPAPLPSDTTPPASESEGPPRARQESQVRPAKPGLGRGMVLLLIFGIGGCVVLPVLGTIAALIFVGFNERAKNVTTMNHMKVIALAQHSFHDTYKQFPPPRLGTDPFRKKFDPKGIDLSWRVSILPFVEQQSLFNRMDRDAEWNSPANQPLADMRPEVYVSLLRDDASTPALTSFQMFTGPDTLYPDNRPRRMVNITDGTSNTLMFAEAKGGVVWSKAEDMVVVPNEPLPLPEGRFYTALLDGSVRPIDHRKTSDAAIRTVISPSANDNPPRDLFDDGQRLR